MRKDKETKGRERNDRDGQEKQEQSTRGTEKKGGEAYGKEGAGPACPKQSGDSAEDAGPPLFLSSGGPCRPESGTGRDKPKKIF